MADNHSTPPSSDAVARVIVLVYGLLENNKPFWTYVAVKPSMYKPFLEAQKEGTINLYKFEEYGEVIIAGEGQSPPSEVTLKVAEVYQTDPAQFFQPMDVDAEVAKRVQDADNQ